ncbi:hypothetical protein LCGC14_0718080 [marine sediment metagenome]|uniref:Uncharacterized protein n=1 Tax=marine sediment metagenome TaxID=412755 RepID=A0A0F9TKN7_9ZZZZ
MKRNKIITISILGMLLLIPFMTPTTAAPASYVGVVETNTYVWSYYQYDWTLFFTDGMPDAFVSIFAHDSASNLTKLYIDWSWTWFNPTSDWDLTVDAFLPENSTILLGSSFIFDNITHTPYNASLGYVAPLWIAVNAQWTDTLNIVNDTSSFAKASLYGGMATTPYWLMGIPIGPNNINWTEFVSESQLGLENYWGGFAANTTMTALPNGYNMSVPIWGYENNTLPITITTTYDTNGVLLYNALVYGSNMIYKYVRADAPTPVITNAPNDFIVAPSYTGRNLSWTATDIYPTTYIITRNAVPVTNATAWTSGVPVVYNITDGLSLGDHTYLITFENLYGVTGTDSVNMTVEIPDTTDPVITSTPSDIVVYIGDVSLSWAETLSWTATDANAGTYTITRNGSVVVPATAWVSGTPVTYNIEGGLQYVEGVMTYEITFSDLTGNTVSDSVTMTVKPGSAPSSPGIPGFEPLIVFGIVAIGSIGLIVLKKKRK